MRRLLVLAALAGCAAVGEAQSFYVEAGYGAVRSSIYINTCQPALPWTCLRSGDRSLNSDSASVRAGYEFTPNIAVEAEWATGTKDDAISLGWTDMQVSFGPSYGAFVVGKLPLDHGTPYVRAGYMRVKLEGSAFAVINSRIATGIALSEAEHNAALGFGAEFNLDRFMRRSYLRLDVTRIFYEDTVTSATATIGFRF